MASSMIDIIDMQDANAHSHLSTSWLGRIKCNQLIIIILILINYKKKKILFINLFVFFQFICWTLCNNKILIC